MEKNDPLPIFVAVAIVAVIGIMMVAFGSGEFTQEEDNFTFQTFESQEDFQSLTNQQRDVYYGLTDPSVSVDRRVQLTAQRSLDGESSAGDVSLRQTNIQEIGIGEPDIVKLSEGVAYYHDERANFYPRPIPTPTIEGSTLREYQAEPQPTRVINTTEAIPSFEGEIGIGGKMLRTDKRLVVYNDSQIVGYDITEPSNPASEWNIDINSKVVTSRRIGDTAYFVLRQEASNCPIKPTDSLEVKCSNIHYSDGIKSADSVYTVLSISMGDGETIDSLSFVGERDSSNVYMSSNSIYVSYSINTLGTREIVQHVLENNNFSNDFESDVSEALKSTDSNTRLKARFDELVRNRSSELGSKEALEFRRQISESTDEYIAKNQRKLFKTQIIELNVDGGQIEHGELGVVPGTPLNQFSFDEKDGQLRVVTTIDKVRSQSQNDLYVLDENLDISGSVKGMAEGQRVYAVRFIQDKAYVITFRQTDPLHVIDLSNSANPEEVGTLELPGFSEYLHRIDEGRIVGVGESQDGRGKVVLFNVSNPSEPTVQDSVIFENSYSTEVSDSHHAFMHDKEMNAMYVPTGEGIQVLKYNETGLEHVETIRTRGEAKRTRILGDYVYVFHRGGVLSFDRDSYEINGGVGYTDN